MSKTEQLKELRALTQAGMKDCNEALTEAGGDLQKAVDIIKTKGKNIVSGREGKIAAEGIVVAELFAPQGPAYSNQAVAMVEINCQTDFVAVSPQFKQFATLVLRELIYSIEYSESSKPFDVKSEKIEEARTALIASTKENIVVRRWCVEEVVADNTLVYHYTHAGNQIGAILSLMTEHAQMVYDKNVRQLAQDLVMQIAAMNPLALSRDKLRSEDVARQRAIFEAQLAELNKPKAAHEKIIEGKFNKWYSEVCLLEQESIVVPKKTVQQVIDELGKEVGTTVTLINMIRWQVGEGIEKPQDQLADEVAKLL
jgi:elongation factor Ts